MITFCPLRCGPPTKPTHKRRILLVDDNWFFAASLRTIIDSESDLVVCDTALSGAELHERIEHFDPELLVLDLSLGAENGLQLAHELRLAGIAMPIVLISTLDTPTRLELERIGHCGFWRKGDSPTKFLRHVRDFLALERAAKQTSDTTDRLTLAPARTVPPPQ